MNEQPEALRLAEHLELNATHQRGDDRHLAAAELRRLHEENERLREAVAVEREACAETCDKTREKPKYRRGDRLFCRENGEYCIIYICGTNRQYVRFNDGYVGEYTNEQVGELFELLPKETDEWVGLTDAVLAEREACAKVCEDEGERFKHHPSGRQDFSICAAAIRARGEP